jgi:hypothetical protein
MDGETPGPLKVRGSITVSGGVDENKKWHEELSKADERGNRFRL